MYTQDDGGTFSGTASIIRKDNIINFHGTPVRISGSNKAECPKPEPDPAAEKEPSLMEWVHVGLAGLSFIPCLGTITSVADGIIYACEGEWGMAALSGACAIPGLGTPANAAKAARVAKMVGTAGKIGKVASAIGKGIKLVRMAAPSLIIGGKMLTVCLKLMRLRGALELAEMLKKGQFDFGNPNHLLFAMGVLSGEGRGKRRPNKGPSKAKPVPRTGPRGVDPNHHNANVLVRDANGNVISHQRIVSGNMTAEEKAMGYPKGMLASHTEARAVRQIPLKEGQTMFITGQQKPCNPCKGAMNRTIRETGANIRYQWRENGKTQRSP